MAKPAEIGTLASIDAGEGFALLVVVQHMKTMGEVVWVSQLLTGDPDDVNPDEVEWRFAVLFVMSSAIRQKVVRKLSPMDRLPASAQPMEFMRSPNGAGGWRKMRVGDGNFRFIEPTKDASLQICQHVNDTRLVELVLRDFRAQDDW